MAIELIEGFDTFNTSQINRRYTTNIWGGAGGNQILIVTPGRNGLGGCIRIPGFGGVDESTCVMPITSRTEYYFGFDYYGTYSGGAWSGFFTITSASGNIIIFRNDNTNVAVAYGAVGGVLVQSAPGTLFTNTWQSVQIYLKINGANSIIRVKVDGSMVLDTIINAGVLPITGVNLGAHEYGKYNYYDNVWIFNALGSHSNVWPIGPMVVQPVYPLTDASYQAWTPNFGIVHYSQIDDNPADDDTTYIYSENPGDIDTYGVTSLTGTITHVHGVCVGNVVRKEASPVAKISRAVINSGSALSEGPNFTTSATYLSGKMISDNDPNTSSEWTTSGINAMKIGVKAQV